MLRPEKGAQNVRADRGSVYPNDLCASLVLATDRLIGVVRMQPLDAAATKDGRYDACVVCGSVGKGDQTLYTCYICPVAVCYRCGQREMPRGLPKPSNDKSRKWFCWDERCQEKAQQQQHESAAP
jgi:hypothetical protein